MDPSIDLSNYKIDQHQYRIGYLSGWKNVTDLLSDYPNKKAVGEHDTLFKLLAGKRLDIVLFNRTAGKKILDDSQEFNYKISSSLLSFSVYLVVHKKHAALVPQLAAKLKKFKSHYL